MSLSESDGEKHKRGRKNVADTNTSGEMMEKSEKLDFYLSMMADVLGRANSTNQIPGGTCKYLTNYKQRSAGY